MLKEVKFTVQYNGALTLASLEEFPSFLKPIVKAAVDSAMEINLQQPESLAFHRKDPNQSCGTIDCKKTQKQSNLVERRTPKHYLTMTRGGAIFSSDKC